MTNVFDVAAYILNKKGEMTAMKLQKLVYYSQVWSLVWDDAPLFKEEIQAWANGPVCPDLYKLHKGEFKISKISKGEEANLSPLQRETIDQILEDYGDRNPHWLSSLTHSEKPWKEARGDTPPGVVSNALISHGAMYEFYASLPIDA